MKRFEVVAFASVIGVTAALVAACSGGGDGAPAAAQDAGTTDGGTSGGKKGGILGAVVNAKDEANACAAASDDDACTSCMKGSCCEEAKSCNGDCLAIFDCADTCGEDEACIDTCIAEHPAGMGPVQAIVTCVQTSCAAKCGDSEPTEGGECLGEPFKDTSYCPDPTRPNVLDCPSGPPQSACTLSPTEAANVYCCP